MTLEVYLVIVAVLTALMLVAAYADAEATEAGIAKGVAVEGNFIIVRIWGTKPLFSQLMTYNLIETAIGTGAAIVGFDDGKWVALMPIGIAWLVALTLKHYQGYRQWNWLMKNPGKTIADQEVTAWQKLIGFWG